MRAFLAAALRRSGRVITVLAVFAVVLVGSPHPAGAIEFEQLPTPVASVGGWSTGPGGTFVYAQVPAGAPVQISWDAVPLAGGYQFSMVFSPVCNGQTVTTFLNVSASTTSVTCTMAAGRDEFCFRIKAQDPNMVIDGILYLDSSFSGFLCVQEAPAPFGGALDPVTWPNWVSGPDLSPGGTVTTSDPTFDVCVAEITGSTYEWVCLPAGSRPDLLTDLADETGDRVFWLGEPGDDVVAP